MKEKLDNILDTVLRTILAILFVFGSCQFLVVGLVTLFGVTFGVMQYVASLVLFILGIASIWGLIRITDDE